MLFFLSLAPYGAFGLFSLVTTSAFAALAGAAVAAAVVLTDAIAGRRTKIFGVGTLLMFLAIAALCATLGADWTTNSSRIAVDAGVLVIILFSLAIGTPFTIQYGRELVEPHVLNLPGFVSANYVLTWVWAAACIVMLMANLMLVYMPTTPLWIGLIAALGIRNAAVYFTRWYPKYCKARAEAEKQALA